ncbi:hypothetical protein ACFW04_013863 [Cataglyphis niger]
MSIFDISCFFILKKAKTRRKTCKKICVVYGKDAVKERVCQKWFARFRSGDFSVQNATIGSRSIEIDSNKIKVLIDTNPRYTIREIANILQISKSGVENHLHHLGYVTHLIKRISISDLLKKREESDPFLK